MALIECPECGKEVSSRAQICVHCGFPLSEWRLEKASILIADLDFSIRTYHCLRRAGVLTLADLTNMTEEDLYKVRNFGHKCAQEVIAKLAEFNLSLKKDN